MRYRTWKVVPALGWVSVTDGKGPRVLIGTDVRQAEQAVEWLNHYASRES